jgi:hypothetical protein
VMNRLDYLKLYPAHHTNQWRLSRLNCRAWRVEGAVGKVAAEGRAGAVGKVKLPCQQSRRFQRSIGRGSRQ